MKNWLILTYTIFAFLILLLGYTISYFNDRETSRGNTIQVSSSWKNTGLLINEVLYNPVEDDKYNEWIELYNPTNNSIDVNNWTIEDNNSQDTIEGDNINGNGSTIIPPNGYAILADKGTKVYENFSIPADVVKLCVDDYSIGNSLGNTEDKLILKNATGAIVDAIEWGSDYSDVPGSPIPNVNQGHSIARYTNIDTDNTLADFYDEDNPTPGSENM